MLQHRDELVKAIMKSERTYEDGLAFLRTENTEDIIIMTAICIERIVSKLKGIINRNGPSFLLDEPYKVYLELLDSKVTDKKTASAILYLMTSRIVASIDFANDNMEEVSKIIRRECSLNKRMADRLSIILTSLYSSPNKKEWKEMAQEGLRQFLKENFAYKWKGFAVWDAGNGMVDCHYEAEIILAPTEAIFKDKELVQKLKNNPFMTKDAIHDLFAKRISEKLDYEFEYYCTCDDYYQPVVEDYGSNLEYDLKEWCKENGFEFVSCEGDGYDDGYEPKIRNGWY